MQLNVLLQIPAILAPGKETPMTTEQEASWPAQPVWTLQKRESNHGSWNVQAAASHYTDCANPAFPFLGVVTNAEYQL